MCGNRHMGERKQERGYTVERMYIESRLWTCLTSEFLEDIRSQYHYEEKDMEQLRSVASDMVSCLKGQERTYLVTLERKEKKGEGNAKKAVVIMTLGANIDILQERYQRTNRMLESYMVESIGGELLMQGYRQLEKWIENRMGYYVAAYHFPGSEAEYPLEIMPELLSLAGQDKVNCNAGFCLQPKKSVVFLVELAAERRETCAGICDACSRREGCVRQVQV